MLYVKRCLKAVFFTDVVLKKKTSIKISLLEMQPLKGWKFIWDGNFEARSFVFRLTMKDREKGVNVFWNGFEAGWSSNFLWINITLLFLFEKFVSLLYLCRIEICVINRFSRGWSTVKASQLWPCEWNRPNGINIITDNSRF